MSTFDGIVPEFPRIRIDYFRKSNSHPAPLAVFLSHVHSDHLAGLESLRSPFIYCSHATKELLLKMEKYPHRINFSKGILESRLQHYKHLKDLLKPLPLHAPTEIELSPLYKLRVTLFDANHCPGAVMFLIEGNGKAVLYTGDVRAEPWFVNSLIRQPVMIPYTLGKVRLDKLYLDTTFAVRDKLYDEFPSKAEGLRELLEAVSAWPDNTTFHFKAWTLGYEDVWVALASALKTQVHVDRYLWQLFKSLSKPFDSGIGVPEGPLLHGFKFGNRYQGGCLTEDTNLARIHSCDSGTSCSGLAGRRVVSIVPIITRDEQGIPIPELGAGGGFGDLLQTPELELLDSDVVETLKEACLKEIQSTEGLANVQRVLSSAQSSRNKTLQLEEFASVDEDKEEISLGQLIEVLSSRQVSTEGNVSKAKRWSSDGQIWKKGDPNYASGRRPEIQFPYSRHSSYSELCALVEAFKPKGIHPCTVDEATWNGEVSMRALFGHLCSGDNFVHDQEMYGKMERRDGFPARKKTRIESSPADNRRSSQTTADSPVARQTSDSRITGTSQAAGLGTIVLGERVSGTSQGLLEQADAARPESSSVPEGGNKHGVQHGIFIPNPQRTLDMMKASFGQTAQVQTLRGSSG